MHSLTTLFCRHSSTRTTSESKNRTCWTKLRNIFGSDSNKDKSSETQQKTSKANFRNIKHVGRRPLASTSVGSKLQHHREFKKLLSDCMGEMTDEEVQKMEVNVLAQVKKVYPEQKVPYDAHSEYEKPMKQPVDPYWQKKVGPKGNEQPKGQAKDSTAKKPDEKPKNKK